MPRIVTGTVSEVVPVGTQAQITICGILEKNTIAALVELALAAGAGLVVQPRALVEAVAAAAPSRALPPARSGRPSRLAAESSDRCDIDESAARDFLKRGPVGPGAFAKHFKLSVFRARIAVKALTARGVVEVTGVTGGRRISLPGHRAKEAP